MPPVSINKPIRLVKLFSGVGAQAMALRNLGVEFEHYRNCEWEIHAIVAYNAIHIKDNTDYSQDMMDEERYNLIYAKDRYKKFNQIVHSNEQIEGVIDEKEIIS